MILLTPLWLGLLVPWAVACVWAGRTDGARAAVPYLTLWPRTPASGGGRRRFPPAWAILLLLASLLAILAAAGPAVERPATTVTVLVDRGLSMPPARRRAAFERLALPSETRVRLVPALPASGMNLAEELFVADVPTALDRLPTTAFDTAGGLLRPAFPAATGPVVILTDRPAIDDRPGVVRVGPPTPLRNAGIDLFAVTAGPHPQAMVRVFNGTGEPRAVLRVDTVRRPINLPPSGQTADVFVDLPAVGVTAEAELLAADGTRWTDDVPADDHAYLAQTERPGRIVPRTPLSDALARMVAVYGDQRPAEADAPFFSITRGPTEGAAVILPSGYRTFNGPALQVIFDERHPVTASVDFSAVIGVSEPTSAPSGEGWRTLLLVNGVTLLAVRETPARQVWVGFDADLLAKQPDYVIFWTNVFDWLAGGGGSTVWAAGPVRSTARMVAAADANLEASPGLFRPDPAGLVIATAIHAVRPSPPLALPNTAAIAGAMRRSVSLIPGLLLAALALAAAGLWIGFRLTRS